MEMRTTGIMKPYLKGIVIDCASKYKLIRSFNMYVHTYLHTHTVYK